MAKIARLYHELRRRRVFKAALLYAVTAWVVVQVSATTFPLLRLPAWGPTLVLVLVLLGFPIMLLVAWFYDVTPAGLVATETASAATAAAPVAQPRSIAVLPFTDMSSNHDQEHFSDGIAEEILNALARLQDLRVAARTSAFAFKGRSEDVRKIGEQLGVATVLEGSVRTSGDRIRITAQLISVSDGYHLWSARYDRELGDIFAIQDEIASSIVRAMDLKIGERAQLTVESTKDLQAYDYYLRGRMYHNRLRRASVEDARDMFRKAIELDPEYARAYAGVAEASALLYMYWDRSDANLALVDEYSARALELAPHLAEAHIGHAYALSMKKQFEAAAVEFEKAIEIEPTSYDAHYLYARSAWAAGDMPVAEREFRRAAAVRSEDYQALALLSSVYREMGKEQEADRIEVEVFARVDRHLSLVPNDARALCFAGAHFIQTGDNQRALQYMQRAMEIDPDEPVTHYNVACGYATMRQPEKAFAALQAALERGWSHREWLVNDGDWAAYREDPRYIEILNRLS